MSFTSEELGGAPSYFAFAAAGVILGLVITASSSGVAFRLREEQVTGTLEAMSTEPVTPFEMCVGLVGFPFAFAVVRSGLYLAMAAIFLDLDLSDTSWSGFVLVLIASGAALAPLGMLAGAAVLVFKRGRHHPWMEFFYFTLVNFVCFAISQIAGPWLVKHFGIATNIAIFTNAVVAALINFVARKFFVFKG